MKKTTTGWLVVLVLFLASFVYILDQRLGSGEAVVSSARVFDITTEPITWMWIVRDGERIEMVRKEDHWFLQEPLRARANQLLVNRLAATAERLLSVSSISAEQRAIRNVSLADYGLDPAAGYFHLEAGGRREKLTLGRSTPFGEGVYGFRHDTEAVVLLPEEALSLLSPSLDDLRDRTLFSGSQRRVTRVDLHRRDLGFLQLMRRGGHWFIQQPLVWPADPEAVQHLLDALYVLQVQRFIWDAPAASDDALQSPAFRSQVEGGHLAPDQARARIAVWVEGSDTGEELFLGGADEDSRGHIYARKSGIPSVFTVPEVLWDLAARPVAVFRDFRMHIPSQEDLATLSMTHADRRLVLEQTADEQWRVTAPIQSAARRAAVEEVLRSLARLRITSFEPVGEPEQADALFVEMGVGGRPLDERQQTELELVPVNTVDDGETQWVGRVGPDGDYYRLSGFVSYQEVAQFLQPERYRSRAIFALDPGGIMRIQQTTVRGDVTLQRSNDESESSAWQLVGNTVGGRERNAAAVQAFMAVLPQLTAASVVAFEPASLVPFGLHAPVTSITLRFADATRLQQSLLVGAAAEDGVPYALLQGHGFIFRLQDADAQILQADLLLPEEVPIQDEPVPGRTPAIFDELEVPVLLLEDAADVPDA